MNDATGVEFVRFARRSGRGAGAVRLFNIVAIHNNYLECTEDETGNAANVARPALNRRDSPEGGSLEGIGDTMGTRDEITLTYTGTQTRTATKVGAAWSPESQTIGPTTYQVGDTIPAVPVNISVQGNDDIGGTVECLYLSLDARCWGTLPAAD